ncbi:MAG: radical SAM protein, partial [Deltaproteobacteria bacterium]
MTVEFRDPPPTASIAADLDAQIASVLVRAPSLPTHLPMFDLTLTGLEPTRDRVELLLARSNVPVARVTLGWPAGTGDLNAQWRWDGPVRRASDRAGLDAMCVRLKRAIPADRWAQAQRLIEQRVDLPRDIPLAAFRMLVSGSMRNTGLVRVGFQCNQDCGICWQGRSWGRVAPDQIVAWIEDLRAAGADTLIISGGEPMLDPELPRYIRRGHELGFDEVTLETNAIQASKQGYAERLRDAGLKRAFVSLHSGDPDASDRVTRAPGTHRRTVAGIQALLNVGIRVALNAVVTKLTIETLPSLPGFVRESFGGHAGVEGIVVSDLGATFDDALMADL